MEMLRKTKKKLQYKYPAFGPRIESGILNELNRLRSY